MGFPRFSLLQRWKNYLKIAAITSFTRVANRKAHGMQRHSSEADTNSQCRFQSTLSPRILALWLDRQSFTSMKLNRFRFHLPVKLEPRFQRTSDLMNPNGGGSTIPAATLARLDLPSRQLPFLIFRDLQTHLAPQTKDITRRRSQHLPRREFKSP